MSQDLIIAHVSFKSASGLSVHRDFASFSLATLAQFRPPESARKATVARLAKLGFKVEAHSAMGASFSGSRELFRRTMGLTVRRQEVHLSDGLVGRQRVGSTFSAIGDYSLEALGDQVDHFELAAPAVLFSSATPPTPSPNYYWLTVDGDVPTRLNADAAHAASTTGTGVRVTMLDTGFFNQTSEDHNATNTTTVGVDHPVRFVSGVWLQSDPNHTGTNYYGNGSFNGSTITLSTALPGANTAVEVVYSCVHPHFSSNNYTIDDVRAVGTNDVNRDLVGHGTAMAANVLAMAPGCTFSFVACDSSVLAGIQSAVLNQNPDVITCSLGTTGNRIAILAEIANAVANGTVVCFAAGNGHTETHGVFAHPDLISVGGTYPIQNAGLRASNYASSFDSTEFTNPQRHAPDLTGLVGETPTAALIMLPVEEGCNMDTDGAAGAWPNGDNTQADDGWAVASGTSAATPQVAGVAALLLQQFPTLTPLAIKNILENSATDVTTGNSNSTGPDSAAAGWDAATGFGLVNAGNALAWLRPGFDPYIRDSVMDNGTEPVATNHLYSSPDIIVRTSLVANPQTALGMTLKHRDDLSQDAEDGQDNYVYLRVQNRGATSGSCTAQVYFTSPGAFHNPASWTSLGTLPINNLAPGTFEVVGPLTWPDATVPTPGHFCLIAVLDGGAADPAPDLTAIQTSQDFVDLVRNSNNVAWKNIRVVDVVPFMKARFTVFLEGPRLRNQEVELRFDQSRFVPGAQTEVRILGRLTDGAHLGGIEMLRRSQLYAYLRPEAPITQIRDLKLRRGETTVVQIDVVLPATLEDGDFPFRTELLIDGESVGAFTDVARLSRSGFVGNKRSKEIHRSSCVWAPRIAPRNRRPFNDIASAHDRGYDNCAVCIGDSKR